MSWALAPGDVLAHYRVISPLGSGGMGQVYLAEDLRLGRRLALKIVTARGPQDTDRLGRFEREARAISALNHPNILTIYDVGQVGDVQFLATEFIDGVTLRAMLARGPLTMRVAVDLGIQVAQALAAAHDAGVVHRDLKPENVMVRADGYVKVLDFGLAKLIAAPSPLGAADDASTKIVETRAGVVMGTFTYMAPEQARGGNLDARADLFSFGSLLYEMLAGAPPFHGPTAADVVSALLLRDPVPLSQVANVPRELELIVETALQKVPAARYQRCADLLHDLRALLHSLDATTESGQGTALTLPVGSGQLAAGSQWSVGSPQSDPSPVGSGQSPVVRERLPVAGSQAALKSDPPAARVRPAKRRTARRGIEALAVLPLANQGGDQELEYFADGLTESLINNLSQVPKLRVMARSTVFRYKGRDVDPRETGNDLGVQAVLTGRVYKRGEIFGVGAELVDVADGSQLWGTLVNRPASDVFVLQAEITREITNALRLRLTRAEKKRLVKQHTANAEAYQLYLRGRYFLNVRTGDALRTARTLFERAVAEDPDYALAYAGLADCCSLIAVSLRAASGVSLIEEARRAALRALELDDGLAEGHASLAFVKFRFDWHWAGAEEEFARAVELNPGHAPSRQWYAMFLASRSRFDAALAEMQRALDLDPLSLIIQSGIGRVLHFAGRLDEAIAQYEHVLATNPGFAQTHVDLALTRMARGEIAAAEAELTRAEALLGTVSTVVLLRTCCAARAGRLDEARGHFMDLRERYERGAAGADDLAMAAAAIGDWPAAREWLARACEQRAPFLGYVDVEPAMAPLLTDPGCRDLLRSHGFDAAEPT